MSKDDESNEVASQSPLEASAEVSPTHHCETIQSKTWSDSINVSDTIYVQSCGTYIKHVEPSHRHTFLQVSEDCKMLKHCTNMYNVSAKVPLLLNNKQHHSMLIATKSILELCHQLFTMIRKVLLLKKPIDSAIQMLDNLNRCKTSTKVTNSTLHELLKTTFSALETSTDDIQSSLVLLEEISRRLVYGSMRNEFYARLKQCNCLMRILNYCDSLTHYIVQLAKSLLKLQFFVMSRTELTASFFSGIIYKCHILLSYISFNKQKARSLLGSERHQHLVITSTFKSCKTKYNFIFIKPCWYENTHVNKYTLSNYISELARLRGEWLLKQISSSVDFLFEGSFANEQKNSSISSVGNEVNGLSSKETLRSKLKDGVKHMKKYYMKIIHDEHKSFEKLLNEFLEINNKILRNNTQLLYKLPSTTNGLSTHKNQIYKRVVQWETNIGPVQREYMYDHYMDTLWNIVKKNVMMFYVRNCMKNNKDIYELNNYTRSKFGKDVFRQIINKLDRANAPCHLLEVISKLSAGVFTIYSLQQWDSGLCKTMGIFLKDRFRYTNVDPGHVCSQTIRSSLQSQFFLLKEQMTDLRKDEKCIGEIKNHFSVGIHFSLLQPLETSCTFLNNCLLTKRQQFLSSASWEPFFVVSAVDMSKIVYYGEMTFTLFKDLFQAEDEMEFKCVEFLKHWKVFEENSLKMMVQAISYRSRLVWHQHMPSKKIWRRRGSSSRAYEASSYINVATQGIFAPIIGSLNCLTRDQSINVICKCVKVFIKTWMEHILNEQILFSRFGSMQLDFDFLHFLQWFEKDGFEFSLEELSEINTLPVVSQMKSAILLLSCQPQGKRNRLDEVTVGPKSFNNNSNLVSSASAISQVSVESLTGNQYEEIIRDVDLHDKERWLALRVKGGSQSKRSFLCVN